MQNKKIVFTEVHKAEFEDCTEIYNQLCDDPAFPMGTVFDWSVTK